MRVREERHEGGKEGRRELNKEVKLVLTGVACRVAY